MLLFLCGCSVHGPNTAARIPLVTMAMGIIILKWCSGHPHNLMHNSGVATT
jgi:hypothetical protein